MKQKILTRSFVCKDIYFRIISFFMIILLLNTFVAGMGRRHRNWGDSQAEEEARKQAEEEARKQAEEEARKQAEEEARRQAEEEARRQAEEEARMQAEEQYEQEYEEEENIPIDDYDNTKNQNKSGKRKSSRFKSLLWSGDHEVD